MHEFISRIRGNMNFQRKQTSPMWQIYRPLRILGVCHDLISTRHRVNNECFVISYSLRQGVTMLLLLSCLDPAWKALLVFSDIENIDKRHCGTTLIALPVKNDRRQAMTHKQYLVHFHMCCIHRRILRHLRSYTFFAFTPFQV